MAAGETVIYDQRKIRDQQIPDSSGHTIPLSVTGGQFKWFIHGAGSGRLIGRAEMLRAAKGISSSYSCPGSSCPPQFSYAYLSPSNIYLGPGDTAVVRVLEVDCDEFFNCIGPFYACYGSARWRINLKNTTLREASNAIVRADGKKTWILSVYSCKGDNTYQRVLVN